MDRCHRWAAVMHVAGIQERFLAVVAAVHPAMPTQVSVVSRMFRLLIKMDVEDQKQQSSRTASCWFACCLKYLNVRRMLPLGWLVWIPIMNDFFMQSTHCGEGAVDLSALASDINIVREEEEGKHLLYPLVIFNLSDW